MNLLRQPYPQNETAGHGWRLAISFGVFVGMFLWAFQPFGISAWETEHKLLKIWGFGAITSGVMVVISVVMPKLLPSFFVEESWTVGKEIGYILVQILLIAVVNRLYLGWLTGHSQQGGWLWSIGITLLVGIFPTTAAVLANYIRQLKQYQQQAATLSTARQVHPSESEPVPFAERPNTPEPIAPAAIKLVAENKRDSFTLQPTTLLAIEASDNYCTIFYAQKDALAKTLMRSSLSRLEGQLSENHPVSEQQSFIRCHRSYVVNLNRVERISGNAQGYKLHLLGGQLTVPVARKYNETLLAGLDQL